jgi:putative transposase
VAVILDAFSRRVVGWALGRSLRSEFAVEALRCSIESRQPRPTLVHHSERGGGTPNCFAKMERC